MRLAGPISFVVTSLPMCNSIATGRRLHCSASVKRRPLCRQTHVLGHRIDDVRISWTTQRHTVRKAQRVLRATAGTAKRVLAIAILSVRSSVLKSHGWISQKPCKPGSLEEEDSSFRIRKTFGNWATASEGVKWEGVEKIAIFSE